VIREVIREAWAQSPAKFIAGVLLTPVALVACWLIVVVVIIAGSPA
jgi:hypothetical protein